MRASTTRLWAALILPAILCGCAGKYALTVPEQVTPPGADLVVVVRLQRYELPFILQSVEKAPMRLQIGEGLERGAYTDELGYAGTTLVAPDTPGQHTLRVAMQNEKGEEVSTDVSVNVWAPDTDIVAVDFDSLPTSSGRDLAEARSALLALERSSRILYLTRRPTRNRDTVRESLLRCGYPDGPILVWLRTNRYLARTGPLRAPRIVVESRMVSRLRPLREAFPGLTRGVCASAASARALARAGVRPIVIGNAGAGEGYAEKHLSWAKFANSLRP
jgi:hypothetical protein